MVFLMGNPAVSSTSLTLLDKLRQSPTDQRAWSDFARRYGAQIYQWCRQWKVQDADAQDLTQTVLTNLVGEMRHFVYRPGGSFRAWLKTIARHALGKWIEQRKRLAPASDELLAGLPGVDDLATRLEEEYDRELLQTALLRVAQRVEPQTWEAFRLTALEGQSGAAVAARVGLQVAMVYVARSRVQKMLREEIQRLDV
jgi:RNA polymerase sigma-70 factor (ECF subfamily)